MRAVSVDLREALPWRADIGVIVKGIRVVASPGLWGSGSEAWFAMRGVKNKTPAGKNDPRPGSAGICIRASRLLRRAWSDSEYSKHVGSVAAAAVSR